MASALRGIFGLSILLLASACGDDGGGGAPAVGGGGNTGGGGNVPGVLLPLENGWVAVEGNTVGIQGAAFSYADTFSGEGMTTTTDGATACIAGTAAKVEMPCEVVAPATDCYGTYWGAAIGLNLNQPIDPATGEGVDPPLAYDATANGVTGFAFRITGNGVPTGMRFKVEDATTEFCTPAMKNITTDVNVYRFPDLVSECWEAGAASANPSAETAKTALVKIAWHVVTNDSGTVPFDFCVSDIHALTD